MDANILLIMQNTANALLIQLLPKSILRRCTGTCSNNVAQTVKICDGVICHVEHGNHQMPFKTVYAATHGQQSHFDMLCSMKQDAALAAYT